jgi:ornithine--oxo-acid transaminase
MTKTKSLIQQELAYGAHNYHSLEVVLARGEGVWVWDVEGNRYLDCLSAYSALNQGHRHPRIVQAMIDQAERITLTSRAFHNDQLPLLAKELCELTGYDKMLPMNSGAEAVETALKAARRWGYRVKGIPDHRAEIIACEGNFHGRTVTVLSMSTVPHYRDGFGPYTPGFTAVPYGDIDALARAMTAHTTAFIVEPIQGEAGVIVPPEGYLKAARDLCDAHNVLMIADEIQSGLGRSGKFFACDWEGVTPDLVTIGKALSGGMMPVSAVLGTEEVMHLFNPGSHGSTFGGNPLGCAIAREALRVIVDEALPERAHEMGTYFRQALRAMASPYVKEVRGKGLLIGVELNEDAGPARPFCLALKAHGILAKDTRGTVIRFAPPLIITRDELDWALDVIRQVLGG